MRGRSVRRAAKLYQWRDSLIVYGESLFLTVYCYLFTIERTIERMRRIENTITKILSHFVLLGSFDLLF